MNGGNILRGIISGAFSAVAFAGVGGYVDELENATATAPATVSATQGAILRVGLKGLIGGIASAINKGNFGAGFLAAGLSATADSFDVGYAGGLVVHAVAGGIGSVAGGGKFANGAETAAFAYVADSVAEEGTIESPRSVSPEQYESMFTDNGLSHAYSVSPAETAFIMEFFNAIDSSAFDGLAGKQGALYATDSASGNESAQIRIFIDGDNIVANTVVGTPCGNGSTTCLNIPPADPSSGRLFFDSHIHPDGNPKPSPLDLYTSATNGGRIGVIQYGPDDFTVYQGHCIAAGCSPTFHGLNLHN